MTHAGGAGQRMLIEKLGAGHVRYVLVGGLAVAAHGYVRATADVDIVFSTDAESCGRLAAVLGELRAEVVLADRPAPEEGITGPWLAEGGHFRFGTEAGALDALTTVAGFDYERLAASAIGVGIGAAVVAVCSLEDLLVMKAAGDRARDRADIEELRRLHGD
ncbi:MAG: hypothetical protein EDQ89_01280 [Acidobacteria bacterium]|nr:MAG: hypothetical protein EDQ89_01280 [Acidobacteriota bacterium]GIK78601.1 MAG: hypothetical protein BroJett022_22910 [Actinomycetes bacterium]